MRVGACAGNGRGVTVRGTLFDRDAGPITFGGRIT